MKKPIFFFWTRSFWFGILPAILALLDYATAFGAADNAGVVAGAIAIITGWDPQHIEPVIRVIGMISGPVVAQQRAGASRPYTLDPRATS